MRIPLCTPDANNPQFISTRVCPPYALCIISYRHSTNTKRRCRGGRLMASISQTGSRLCAALQLATRPAAAEAAATSTAPRTATGASALRPPRSPSTAEHWVIQQRTFFSLPLVSDLLLQLSWARLSWWPAAALAAAAWQSAAGAACSLPGCRPEILARLRRCSAAACSSCTS